MHKTIAIAAITIVLGLTGAASAHGDGRFCRGDQGREQISAEKFRQQVDGLGYAIDRQRTKHGCIEAYLVDRSSGGRVKALFSAANGELVRARLAD